MKMNMTLSVLSSVISLWLLVSFLFKRTNGTKVAKKLGQRTISGPCLQLLSSGGGLLLGRHARWRGQGERVKLQLVKIDFVHQLQVLETDLICQLQVVKADPLTEFTLELLYGLLGGCDERFCHGVFKVDYFIFKLVQGRV